MSAQLGLVCECVQKGLLLFFFVCVEEKKPNNQFQTVVVAKERKSREREREREEKSNREKKKSLASLTTLSPLCVCLPSSLKATKRFESGRRRRRSS